jgi:hypothetical protein
MSEYQYYEFRAIDRPLTAKEMAELRACSTRARITPASFVNDYAWGSFRGNEDAWMEKYFDAFLYLANWGTHVLKLRLPARLLDPATAQLYCAGESAFVREVDQKTILSFVSQDEGGGEWVEEGEAEGQLASLIALRSALARGDLRALYLGWLLCAQSGDFSDEEVEPPVPAGLAQLDAALDALVEFLRIDADLLEAAAAASPPLATTEPDPAAIRQWLAQLPVADKDDYLARLMTGQDGAIADELARRMRQGRDSTSGTGEVMARRRTVAELLAAGEQAADERKRIAAEKAAKEKARREGLARLARAQHLNGLAGKEPVLWGQVDELVATKLPKAYDRALELLVDLRDLAARNGAPDFRRRIEALRTAHARKPTLIGRLDKAGL